MEPNAEIERALEKLARTERPSGWPPRWDAPPLDPDTVEWIARLNEAERRNLIELSHLSEENLKRVQALLALDKETWEAGIRLATRSAAWSRIAKRFPGIVLALAGFLVALNTIWGFVGPTVKAMLQGPRP